MKDYSALKREIQQYIRTNNNQEITGEVLQNVLVSIVSNVGENAGFGGIAKKTTSPGTPDGPVFYFATEQGVYPNFGGLEIERENTLNIIYNTEDGWDTLFLGNLVPNEEVEDFRTFKHLENMNFEQASEYCATFDNIIEKIGGGAIRFSRPVIFTFSYGGTDQGMIINSPSSNRVITQYAFTKGNINSGFSHRLIQYNPTGLTITNVGEWMPISSLIPAATTSAAGLMSKEDKIKLDNALTDLIQEDETRGTDGYKFKLKHVKAGGGSGYTQISIPPVDSSRPYGAGVMTSPDKLQLDNSLKELEGYIAGDTLGIRASRNRTDLAKSSAILPLAKAHNETSDGAPKPGIMSGPDKNVLGTTGEVNVTNCSDNLIDTFTRTGTYRVFGERTNANDGLPILNSNPGHTVEGILKVLDSSISGSGEDTDKVVTQVLTMSNRTGADGHIWIRTGQGASDQGLTWSTWEKLQGIFEKNNVTTLEDLDGYTTNGMYSGIYAGTEPKNFYTVPFIPLDTFLMITVNGYAVSKLAVPQITQLLYKLPAKTSTGKQNAEIYLRTGSYNKTDKVWDWGNFTKMVTNHDLFAQVAKLTDNINQKQDALTLTVKDNGNIVLANIQGQSKEFMPATPSGDPMHYAYVTAGAEYNDTGADIVKDAPWADMLDDDYDGPYGKTVVHKAGYWYLNGLGDITNDEIRKIYIASSNFPGINMQTYFGFVDFRTNFSGIRKLSGYASLDANGLSDGSTKFSILNLSCLKGASISMSALNSIIVHILGTNVVLFNTKNILFAKNLITAPFIKLKDNLNIGDSPVLSVKSVLYMINNENAKSPITITLHADVYSRCMANADILAALEAHTNISLASA